MIWVSILLTKIMRDQMMLMVFNAVSNHWYSKRIYGLCNDFVSGRSIIVPAATIICNTDRTIPIHTGLVRRLHLHSTSYCTQSPGIMALFLSLFRGWSFRDGHSRMKMICISSNPHFHVQCFTLRNDDHTISVEQQLQQQNNQLVFTASYT